jgi:threonine dehydratase
VADQVSYGDILAARARIEGGVVVTPCYESVAISRLTGSRVYCKAEYLQRTGSFKERGARNALLLLTDLQRKAGVVAASAGNHALALAYHGQELGIPVTVVMPVFAPLIKQSRCRDFGAEVLLFGQNIAEAKSLADELARDRNLTYVHGFNGPDVIAGAGTLGLEIMDQVPSAEIIVVPVGGGGLIAGLGLAVKTNHPNTRIVGVETKNSASLTAALQAGRPVLTELHPTLADGLAVPEVGSLAFSIARDLVDDMVQVDEESVALAILRLAELEKGVVEGAGASPLAALLAGAIPDVKGRHVVLALCGGNIDPMVFGRVIEHALVADGRLTQFRAVISDRPGGLAELCERIAAVGGSVKQILHERTFASADVSTVEVQCTVETKDHAHAKLMLEELRAASIPCAIEKHQFIA